MANLPCDTKRKQFFSEVSPTESMFLKNFGFYESDITESNYNNFWEF